MRAERPVLDTNIRSAPFDRYVSHTRRSELLADFEAAAEWTAIIQTFRDPDDDKFLETAMVAQADCIVTGDDGLLALDPFEHIRIITAAGFLELVRRRHGQP